MKKLEAAVAKNPSDADARLALSDARFAQGDKAALGRALDRLHRGGLRRPGLREAIRGRGGHPPELSPYRHRRRKVIAEFEAPGEVDMPGTAARVLDYSAIWVHADGSARMLEHEILCIQSREGIQEQAEQRPHGLARSRSAP